MSLNSLKRRTPQPGPPPTQPTASIPHRWPRRRTRFVSKPGEPELKVDGRDWSLALTTKRPGATLMDVRDRDDADQQNTAGQNTVGMAARQGYPAPWRGRATWRLLVDVIGGPVANWRKLRQG